MHVCDIFSVRKLANSNLMQVYIESVIQFGLTKIKFLKFLNRPPPFVVIVIVIVVMMKHSPTCFHQFPLALKVSQGHVSPKSSVVVSAIYHNTYSYHSNKFSISDRWFSAFTCNNRHTHTCTRTHTSTTITEKQH